MKKVRLGRTGLWVTKTSFGALPIQRVDFDTARAILRRAYDSGINFFDTARSYTDSEEKIGYSLSDVRKDIYIATKTPARTKEQVLLDVQTSLKNMRTDYVDILQLHNAQVVDFDDPDGSYAGLLEAKKRGYCRFIGGTYHSLDNARKALESGMYDTIQYPFNFLSSPQEEQLVRDCAEADIGFICMKALSGGLISDVRISFAHLRQFEHVVPIYGIQRMSELEEFLELEKNPPVLEGELLALLEKDRAELSGSFCRACGYCMPCPAQIQIPTAARMSLLIRRSPFRPHLSDESRAMMENIENCLHCGQCSSRCPYGLDTPSLLMKNLIDYREFYAEHIHEV